MQRAGHLFRDTIRSRVAACATFFAVAGFLAGGCSSGTPGVRVSVQNLSTVVVEASVQPIGAGQVPGDATTLTVPVGEERAATFAEGSDASGVSVDIAPADRTGVASLQRYLLQGPSPYLVSVSGNENGLSVTRTEPEGDRGPNVPADYRESGAPLRTR